MELFTISLAFIREIWEVLAIVGAGIGSFYLGYRRFRREEKVSVDERLDKFYAEIKSESQTLKDEKFKMMERIAELQRQITELLIFNTEMKTKWDTLTGLNHKDVTIDRLIEFGMRQNRLADTLEKFVHTFPGILWMKEVEKDHTGAPIQFRIFTISQTYADTYLHGDRNVYLGKLDKDIWKAETAELFEANDVIAYNSRMPLKVVEPLTAVTGVEGVFVGWKWSISVEGMDYVCGYGEHFPEGSDGYEYWQNTSNG